MLSKYFWFYFIFLVKQDKRVKSWCWLFNLCNSEYSQGVWYKSVYYEHNIYPLFWFQIQTLLLKMLFQRSDFLHSTVQSFIDVFKCNKYKNTLINSFYFCIYNYIKLLKRSKLELTTDRKSALLHFLWHWTFTSNPAVRKEQSAVTLIQRVLWKWVLHC